MRLSSSVELSEIALSLSGEESLLETAFEVTHGKIVVLGCFALCDPPLRGFFLEVWAQRPLRSYKLHNMSGFEVVTSFSGEQNLLESVFEVAHVKIVVLGCFALCVPYGDFFSRFGRRGEVKVLKAL